jgi:hypothetical protein
MRAANGRLRTAGGERGVSGATAALALGAFGIGGALLGGVILSAGYSGSAQLEQTLHAALGRSARGLELRGPVHLLTDGGSVTHVLLDVGALPGSDGVMLDTTTAAQRTVVSYDDGATLVSDVPYAVRWISGDGDALLEAGELAQIEVDAAALPHALGEHDRFRITLRPADGVPLAVERRVPAGNAPDAVVILW